MAAEALALSPGRDVRIAAAMTWRSAAMLPRPRRWPTKLNAESPSDTIIQSYWLPTIRATMALQQGDAKQAITLLEVATPYELGLENVSAMVPIYVRGLAYLKAGKGPKRPRVPEDAGTSRSGAERSH